MPALPRRVQERLFSLFFALTEGVGLDSSSALFRQAVFLQLVEMLQVLRVMCSHRFGWTDSSMQILQYGDVVYLLSDLLSNIVPRYSFFIIAVVLSVGSIGLCYFVVKLLKMGTLQRMWPVKMLRLLITMLLSVLFISILNWLLMPVECIASKEDSFSSYMQDNEACHPWEMPTLLVSVPSIVLAMVLSVCASFTARLDYEINPLSMHPLSLHTGLVEAQFVFLKVAVSALIYFSELVTPVVIAFILLSLAYRLFNAHIAILPFHSRFTNDIRGGVHAAILWLTASSVLVAAIKTSEGDEWDQEVPSYMQPLQYGLIGFLPLAFGIGVGFSLYTQRRLDKSLNRLRGDWERAEPGAKKADGESPMIRGSRMSGRAMSTENDASKAVLQPNRGAFERFFDVEWESRRRFASDWKAVALVRNLMRKRNRGDIGFMRFIMRKAMEEHPESKLLQLLLLVLNRFVFLDVHEAATLQKSLDLAKKDFPLEFQFVLFCAERRGGAQDMRSTTVGGGDVSGVYLMEFEQSMERARKAHLGCVTKMREFWRFVRKRKSDFVDDFQSEDMMQQLEDFEEQLEVAKNEYDNLLDKYPQAVALLRSYAHFCDVVLNDYKEAEKRAQQAELLDGEERQKEEAEETEEEAAHLEFLADRSASTTEGESYRLQLLRYFSGQREAIMGDEVRAVKTLHSRVWQMLFLVVGLATAGFCVTDMYLFKDILVKNIELIDKTGLFRAYSISSSFLLRSAYLSAHANNTAKWETFTGNCRGAMERLRGQHFLNYDSIPSGRISEWYHESDINYDVPIENRWERRSDHYWNVANDFARRVSRGAETPMSELLEGNWRVGTMSEAKAQVAYAYENTQTFIIPMFETMVKMYEDEVFAFGRLTMTLIIANTCVNSLLVIMISFFVLRAMSSVMDSLQSKYVYCTLALSLPRNVASSFYKYYDSIEIDMRIVEDEEAEHKATLMQDDPDHDMDDSREDHGGEQFYLNGGHFGHDDIRPVEEPEPGGGVGEIAGAGNAHGHGHDEHSTSRKGFGLSFFRKREKEKESPPPPEVPRSRQSQDGSQSTVHEPSKLVPETIASLRKAMAKRETWILRRSVYYVALSLMLGMCIFSMVYPARNLPILVNFGPTQNQAGRRRYLVRSCAHFTRELVLNDGFTRMDKDQITSALRFHLQELRDADRGVRMGGVHDIHVGADYRNQDHNILMYGEGCSWREDPEDCSTPDMPGRDDVNRHGLQYLLVSFYDAVETVLSRYGTPIESHSMDFRTHPDVASVDDYDNITYYPDRVAKLSSDKDVKFIIAGFAGDVFNGLGGVLALFTQEIKEVLATTRMETRLLFGLYLATILVIFYLGLFRRTVNVAIREAEKSRWYVMMLPAHVLKGKDVHTITAFFNPAILDAHDEDKE